MTIRNCLAAAMLVCLLPAHAQLRLEGQTFDARSRVAGSDLVLNGAGLRAVAWLKGYAAALYLPARADTPASVLATGGAKRLQIRMLQDVPAQEFVKAFDKGVARNTPAADQAALAGRMATFTAQIQALGQVRKGDVVDLDFLPQSGLLLSLNGKPRGEPIPGEDLYGALLRIFLGDRPVDAKLKTGLLGGPSS